MLSGGSLKPRDLLRNSPSELGDSRPTTNSLRCSHSCCLLDSVDSDHSDFVSCSGRLEYRIADQTMPCPGKVASWNPHRRRDTPKLRLLVKWSWVCLFLEETC